MTASRRAPHRDLLLANHRFPCAYVIKAFGPSEASFRSGIEAACVAIVTRDRVQFSERESRGGNKLCITAVLDAEHVDEVISLYERLYEVPGLSLIL